jgi:beta-glucosidase
MEVNADDRLNRICRLRTGRAALPVCLLASVMHGQVPGVPERPWMNRSLAPGERAALLVRAMTLDEKIEQIALNTGPNPELPGCGERRDTRHMEGIPRLGIPTYRMTNGPIGVAGGDCNPNPASTALPTALLVAATWNGNASFRWGEVAGIETRAIAHQAFLAPGTNLARVPESGRNFEYFGEDPYLSGVMTVQQVKAVQAQGTEASVKHFVANEQETDRMSMNTIVDDRTLHELYMLPFEMAVRDSHPASVLCSYPKIGGLFACESAPLLTGVLRGQWGFQGYVISDRKALHSTATAIRAGLDIELDSKAVWFTPEKVKAALAAHEIAETDLDAMLKRRFTVMFELGQLDHPAERFTPIDFESHAATALAIAEEGIVLLKNEKALLPLNAAGIKTIALIGAASFAGAAKLPVTGPKGVIAANSPHVISPLQGLNAALKKQGSAATVSYDDGTDLARAVALAGKSDVAIVMAGDISLEGEDRPDLSLPFVPDAKSGVAQDVLIAAVAATNPRTVLVLKDGGPVLMPWLGIVPAVIEAWYPGQEDGTAVANVLFGIVNPSGKLPLTFPSAEHEGVTATPEQSPGVMVDGVRTVTYAEKLEMGYRWYDAHKVRPLFPFGYGLSYTTFSLSGLEVARETDGNRSISVRFELQNTGKRAGADVAQVYLSLPASAGEPPRRLVAFQKVVLAPGEKKRVELVIDPAASNHPLGYWDSAAQKWAGASGDYEISVGDSSANTPLRATVTVRR